MSHKKTQEQKIPPVIYSDTRTIYSVNVRKSKIGLPKTVVPFPERYIFSNGPLIKIQEIIFKLYALSTRQYVSGQIKDPIG